MVRKTYFDIVPVSNASRLTAEDLRSALRRGGYEPADRAGYAWMAPGHERPGGPVCHILSSSEPRAFFSNTKTLRIYCPVCGREIPKEHWLLEALTSGTSAFKFFSKCCNSLLNVRELVYDPAVYFSRTAISVLTQEKNAAPPISLISKLEETLGERLDCVERIC